MPETMGEECLMTLDRVGCRCVESTQLGSLVHLASYQHSGIHAPQSSRESRRLRVRRRLAAWSFKLRICSDIGSRRVCALTSSLAGGQMIWMVLMCVSPRWATVVPTMDLLNVCIGSSKASK